MTRILRSRTGQQLATVALGMLCALTAACGSSSSYPPAQAPTRAMAVSKTAADDSMGAAPSAPAPEMPQNPGRPQSAPAMRSGSSAQAKQAPANAAKQAGMQQKLIFTSRLDLEVDGGDLSNKLTKVADIASQLGGYIADQNDTSITVRVPSADFRNAMREIEKEGEVLHRSVKAQDVTEEFHDVGVRLKSLLATRDRLQKFLDRAKSLTEVLRVEQELTRLNTEIDKLRGRLRYLEARAAFSTITVALQARAKAPVKVVKKKAPPPPPPGPQTAALPIKWINSVGVDNLLRLK